MDNSNFKVFFYTPCRSINRLNNLVCVKQIDANQTPQKVRPRALRPAPSTAYKATTYKDTAYKGTACNFIYTLYTLYALSSLLCCLTCKFTSVVKICILTYVVRSRGAAPIPQYYCTWPWNKSTTIDLFLFKWLSHA